MICPVCANEDTNVSRTFRSTNVYRWRTCGCGAAWNTNETVDRKSIRMMQGVQRTKVPAHVVAEVLKRDGYACKYCGATDSNLGVDHVTPLVAPIPDNVSREAEAKRRSSPENLVACCGRCNSAKGDKVDGRRMAEAYVKRRSLMPLGATNSHQDRQIAEEPPLGGRGGSDPLLFPVLLPSDPSQQSGSGRAIRRGRRDSNEYTMDFLVLWDVARKQGKVGNKLPAFKSFTQLGADDHLNALILTRFEEWMKTDAWKRGFNPHLSTWLNQRGWEESPTKADISGKPEQSQPTSIEWGFLQGAK